MAKSNIVFPNAENWFSSRLTSFTYWGDLGIYFRYFFLSRPYLSKIGGWCNCLLVSTVHSTPEQAIRFRALSGNIVLCSWARHSTLMVRLFTLVHKSVPANIMVRRGRVTLRWTNIPSRWSANTPSLFMLLKLG